MVLMTSQDTVLKAGDSAPDFSLKGVDGEMYSLSSFSDKKALLVIFMCNHCPYVIPKFPYFSKLQDMYGSEGLQVVGICPNDPERYPDDNFENMKRVAEEEGFTFTYLVDETQEISKSYGAVCTPDPYLFDSDRKLVYHGRFNDKHLEPHENGSTSEMEDAIKQVLAGEPVTVEVEPSQGCSIKWKPGNEPDY